MVRKPWNDCNWLLGGTKLPFYKKLDYHFSEGLLNQENQISFGGALS